MSELPQGWQLTKLDDLFNLVYGKGLRTKDLTEEGYDVYGANGIIGKFTEFNYEKSKVLISCRGAASGAIHKTNPNSFVTSNSIVLDEISDELLDLDFVKYCMTSLNKDEVITGTAQPQITIQLLKDLKFPLPPLGEQKRMVAKLDVLFGELESLKGRLANIPELLKNFRQAVLTQAVTGKLTAEWRIGKDLDKWDFVKKSEFRAISLELDETWNWGAFGDIAQIKSNLVAPLEYLDKPLIAPDNIESETGKLINKPLVSDIMPKSNKHYFEEGVIVYSKIRPYLSKLIVADFDGLCSADMYPISTEMDIKYLYYYMLSGLFLQYANSAGERSVLPKINQKGLNQIPVSVPPKKEQEEIVHRVEGLFAQASAIEESYQQLKNKIDTLPQAILAKAFRGELVEQLPTDGDAKELLEEIKALKESLKPVKKTRAKK